MASSTPSARGSARDMQPAGSGSINLARSHCRLPQAAASQQHHPRWLTCAACPATPTRLVILLQCCLTAKSCECFATMPVMFVRGGEKCPHNLI